MHIIFEPQPVLPSGADKFAFLAGAGTLRVPSLSGSFRAGLRAERKRWLVLREIRRRKSKVTETAR